MTFQLKYVDLNGKKHTKRVQAHSTEEALEKARLEGVTILSLQPSKTLFSFLKTSKKDFSKESLILFTTQLSQLLDAGLPLYESLLSLIEQYKKDPFAPIIENLAHSIREGASFSKALRNHPKSFSPLYISLVEAGEHVGSLSTSLEKLTDLLARQQKLKKQLITALIYPTILITFSFGLIALLLSYVVPSLENLFEGRPIHAYTQSVFALSHFLRDYWIGILFFLSSLSGFFVYSLKIPRFKRLLHHFSLKIPLLNTLLIHIALSRFCRTMGTLLEGGVSIIKALKIARCVIQQPDIEEVIKNAQNQIIEGSMLSKELAKSPLIPTMVVRMLAVGEEGGHAAQMHKKIASLYEEEVEKVIERLMTLIQPLILVIIGAIVGFIMLAILLPLTDVTSFIQ